MKYVGDDTEKTSDSGFSFIFLGCRAKDKNKNKSIWAERVIST